MTSIDIIALPGAKIPEYQTPGAAGFDLYIHSFKKLFSNLSEVSLEEKLSYSLSKGFIHLRPGERVLAGTGLFMKLPEGCMLDIRSRSGTALKKGLIVLNQPGTIDNDYTGEIGIILYNSTQTLLKVSIGERVAQAVLMPSKQIGFNVVEKLPETERGAGGFGSTGDK